MHGKLMFEMTFAGQNHRNAILIARVNYFLVAYGTARLNDGTDAMLMRNFNVVRHWKKCMLLKLEQAR